MEWELEASFWWLLLFSFVEGHVSSLLLTWTLSGLYLHQVPSRKTSPVEKYILLKFERSQVLSSIMLTSSMPVVLHANVQFLHFCGNFYHILSHYPQWSVLCILEKSKFYFSFFLSCLSMLLLVFCLSPTVTKVLRRNFLTIRVLSGTLGHCFFNRTQNSSDQYHWKSYNRSKHTLFIISLFSMTLLYKTSRYIRLN